MNLHCTHYDTHLQSLLHHLTNYPEYLPFIGKDWDMQLDKVLFIGESHYLHKKSKIESNWETWYNGNSVGWNTRDIQHIHTRGVIKDAEKRTGVKAYSIFYNIKEVLIGTHGLKRPCTIFHNFSYYNYFQRPAEKTGESIINSQKDDKVAYQTLVVLTQLIKPTLVVFVSKKAYISYLREDKRVGGAIFNKGIKIDFVPHPASAWWNRKSKAYNNRTGKAKFIELIKNLKISFS